MRTKMYDVHCKTQYTIDASVLLKLMYVVTSIGFLDHI